MPSPEGSHPLRLPRAAAGLRRAEGDPLRAPRAAPVTAAMAFPNRPDAPELPDFSMLKRLARDQLIYLLEQVSARHAGPLAALTGHTVLWNPLEPVLGLWHCPRSFWGRPKMKPSGRETRGQ